MELAMKSCGSQLRSKKLVVWGECQGKWRENCQKGSEAMEKLTDWPTREKRPFFSLKGRWHLSRKKTGNWEKKKKKEGKIVILLLALVSQKLSDTHQWQLPLCFGHREMCFKERVPDGHIFAKNQCLVCLRVLHTGNCPPLSLSNVSWTREDWSSVCCCFGSVA